MTEDETRTILLVEDMRIVAIQQRRILEKHGFTVVTSATGEDAVSACRDDRSIGLVLMDIDLGDGIDGTEAARRILAARELPIVFLTGHTEREYVERVEQITRYGYVVKQAGELVLIQTIRMAFELFDAHRRSREQEQRFRLVYENMAAGVIQVGLDTRIQAANDAFCRMLGYEEEELRGRYISEITGAESVEDTERLNERLQRAEVEHFRLEKTYLHKSGQEIRGILDANIVRTADRSPVCYLGSVVDITDYRNALAALSRSEEKFRNIFDSTNDVILVHEMSGRFLEANEPACRYLGYSREELLQLTVADVDAPEHAAYAEERIDHVHRHGRLVFESVHRRKDGTEVPVEVSSTVIEFEGRECVVSVVRDIGMRRARQQATRAPADERRYRHIVENSPDGFWLADDRGRVIDVNEAYCSITGYTREELLTMSIADVEANEDTDEVMRHITRLREHGTGRFETVHRRKDGGLVEVEVNASYYEDIGGGIFAFLRDIGERKRAERELATERYRLQAILEGTNVATWEWNVQTGETRFDERWAAIVGYTLAEISPVSIRTWQEFTHPEDLAHSEELLRAHFAGESEYYDSEVRMRHADGRWVWVRDRGKVAEWTDDGRPRVVFGTHEDITERKNLEAEREQALEERTALMRELTHRTKNNLMMVSSLIELKDQALAERADLADLRNQVNAIRVVHERLHQSPETITHIDFREYAQELLATVFSFSPEAAVSLEIDAPDISLPTSSAVTLGLVMNELATNAVKYGFRGADTAVFRLQTSVDDSGREMTLRVSNTGTPIGTEVDFDAPHSLGLQLVQAMVAQLQGTIRLEREPVTTFTITVPLSE